MNLKPMIQGINLLFTKRRQILTKGGTVPGVRLLTAADMNVDPSKKWSNH